ncbi:MAG: primosomal protein N' [Bacteroidota bacterium]
MSHSLVTVALPVPLPQLFTYSVPPSFEPLIVRGSIVVVPFGNKILVGVVFDFTQTVPRASLKHVLDVLPNQTNLTPEHLKTAQWISDYYHSPIGETVRLFLHVGLSQISERQVFLTKDAATVPLQGKKKNDGQRIVSALTNGPLSVRRLQQATGIRSINSLVSTLAADGVVSVKELLSAQPNTKTALFLRRLSKTYEELPRRKNQARLVEHLRALEADEVQVKSFLSASKTTLQTLKALALAGYIDIVRKEISRRREIKSDEQTQKSLSIVLNKDQRQAVESIVRTMGTNSNSTFLLHGVTGSGKTQVYIEAIRHALEQGKSSIILVPEISLTPQTVRRFQAHFGDTVIWMHSKMSDGERYDAWRLTKEGTYKIVIGPRSALFAPVQNLGLIVVDEEHESSYKQFDATPRYHARDVAVVRGMMNNAVVVLGSATPSIESYANALEGKYTLLTLPERADNAQLPPVEIIDMVEERKQRYAKMKVRAKEIGKKAFEDAAKSISSFLEMKIRDRLEKKEGIILLQNRRGFAPFIECSNCGHVEQCDRCSVTMTYHATKKHLRCHYCGKVKSPPTTCSHCGGFEFAMRGFGTQRVEEELKILFPTAKILRMDLDTTSRKHSHEKILQQFGKGEADILLGTQMVAKGLDFPRVTLVGVISADTQMMLPDFRSAERTFQLLTQVAGRAGRSTLRGEVVIQTSQSSHYALKHVQDHDFVSFYNEEIAFRKSIGYPPFSRIVVVEIKGKNEKHVEAIATLFGKKLSALLPREGILGPSPAVLSKIKNDYRWHILVKANKESDKNGTRARTSVARVADDLQKESLKQKVKIIVDVDPAGIL